MRKLLLAAVIVAASCATMSGSLRVRVEPANWAPGAGRGIGLLPDLDRPADEQVRIRWTADFGRFVSSEAPADEPPSRLSELTTGREKVFWNYDLATAPTHRRPVNVRVEALDWKTGAVLVETGLTLVWEGDAVRLR